MNRKASAFCIWGLTMAIGMLAASCGGGSVPEGLDGFDAAQDDEIVLPDVLDDAVSEDTGSPSDVEVPDTTMPSDVVPDPGTDIDDVTLPEVVADVSDCPQDLQCVEQLPAVRHGNTAVVPDGEFDSYACKPTADESGPEVAYRVRVDEAGFLSAAVYEDPGVDVDVHILASLDPSNCLSRGNYNAGADVVPGDYFVVVDTFVSGGVPKVGPYRLEIGLLVPSAGPCAMESGVMPRVGDGGNPLVMPATGPVVQEAHLVTQDEPPPYPTTSTENLDAHVALSQAASGLVMHRREKWAPMEGADNYGIGIGSPTLFPALHEAWYVNMYWTSTARPTRGTRMILRVPGTRRAVVVAAGYETGPGNLSNIGGTVEETHFYLGTVHQSEITLGIASDQTLPFGPRVCD